MDTDNSPYCDFCGESHIKKSKPICRPCLKRIKDEAYEKGRSDEKIAWLLVIRAKFQTKGE